jgi:hypothetical protein
MEVGYAQQIGLSGSYPFFFFMTLALGTMTVTATVVAKMQLMASRIVATIDVAAKGSSAALAKCMKGTYLPTVGTISGKVFPVAFQDLGYFVSSRCHYSFS